jgi:hypothetical protein
MDDSEIAQRVADQFADGQRRREQQWPEPSVERPSDDQTERWVYDSVVGATDGCRVEADGTCPHGHPSWLLAMGLV